MKDEERYSRKTSSGFVFRKDGSKERFYTDGSSGIEAAKGKGIARGSNMVDHMLLAETSEEVIKLLSWYNHFLITPHPDATDDPSSVLKAAKARLVDLRKTCKTIPKLEEIDDLVLLEEEVAAIKKRKNKTDKVLDKGASKPEWSMVMSKANLATALSLDSVYKFNTLVEGGIYEIRQVGESRESWQVRIDKLSKHYQEKLR